MFRFSIRELMALTLAAAMGMAWWSEHQDFLAAATNAIEAKKESQILEKRCKWIDENAKWIEVQIAEHGLEIRQRCIRDETYPVVYKIPVDHSPDCSNQQPQKTK